MAKARNPSRHEVEDLNENLSNKCNRSLCRIEEQKASAREMINLKSEMRHSAAEQASRQKITPATRKNKDGHLPGHDTGRATEYDERRNRIMQHR